MPQLDKDPIDPEIAATLDAIDATLAGEPVDGRFAEVAEIALLLASERPQVPPAFAESMDAKVQRRFAPIDGKARRFGAGGPRKRRRWSGVWQGTGAVAAGAAAIVAIAVVAGGGHGASSGASSSAAAGAPLRSLSSASPANGSGSATSAHSVPARAPSESGSAANGSAAGSAASVPPIVQPPTSGRKVVQGAQLNLSAAANRVEAVAQEIYNVVGQANGIVENSSVTQGGPGAGANFQLSLPSGGLAETMSQLSTLNYAQVVSRTDSSQDITDQYGATTRALADERARRTSLLKQLANATTTEQVDSLNAQIHDAEASISSDQATLNRLNHSVNYSQVYVTVAAKSGPVPASHGGGGFTIGRAAHDAGRVLTVAAGVALIAIAALTPVALVVALVWWVGSALKRRRREQALDSV
ncbi:MAG TPA: DUF4349 domain-containing protein [Solirubrobacteraceae bacterium]|nr:DUF4349 domain-containing protein [Solirubrobacteraceae bacterium]